MLFSGNKFQMCPQKFPTLRLHCWSVVAGTKAINSRVYVASVSLQDVRKARKKVLSFFEREISTRKLRQLCRKNFFIEQNKTFFEDRIKLEDFPSIQKKVTQRVIIQIVFFWRSKTFQLCAVIFSSPSLIICFWDLICWEKFEKKSRLEKWDSLKTSRSISLK